MTQELLFAVLGLVAGGALMWWLSRRDRGGSGAAQQQLQQMSDAMAARLDRVTEQLDARLRENARAVDASKLFVADRVSHTERAVREITGGLARLEQATGALRESTNEIANFQNLLKNPKMRGGFGEVLLGNLLGEMLPADRFVLQYQVPGTSEIADAIIRLQDNYIVAVDAKFPLSNYERYSHEEEPQAKKRLRAELVRDIKKHVADISKKYIVPSERTLDFAFMYVPVESVYYDIIVRGVGTGSVWEYCMERKVIPVSPNSFIAYLYTILVGLRGLRVEEQAREILERLRQVRRDFQRFGEDFTMVGKHLTNAKNRFDDSARRLDTFGMRLEQIEGVGAPVLSEGARVEVHEEEKEPQGLEG